jgi:dipeptidyl aminopeptidase/acylaminoacyl peptidase
VDARALAAKDPGVIVFRGEDGGWYAMKPDGSGLSRFALPRFCVPLDFAADGRTVVCARPRSEHVYVMRRDGANRRRVPPPPRGSVADPSLSPSGRQLVFTSARTAEAFDVWKTSSQGTNPQRLVVGGINQQPRWSPDGRRIAYVHGATPSACAAGDVVVIDANGRNPRVIARRKSLAQWSPEGKQLAFVDDCGTITAAPAGSRSSRVLARFAYTPEFAWSRDSAMIAFPRQQDRCGDGVRRGLRGAPPECTRIFVVRLTRGGPKPVGKIAISGGLFWLGSAARR